MQKSFEYHEALRTGGYIAFDLYRGDELVERREFRGTVSVPGLLKNLIVAEGKERLAGMLGGNPLGSFVKFIAVGTNPVAATDADTYAAIKSVAGRVLREFVASFELCPGVFSVSDPTTLETPPVARFEVEIGETELVGSSIGELMLVFNDKQVMFARKSLGGTIEKLAGFKIVITWFIVMS